jgi:predicted Zn-dependent protease
MIKLLLFSLFLFSSSVLLVAQSDYTPIRCAGDIPPEFIVRTSDKIARANAQYRSKKENELSRKEFSKYNSMTNFYVDYLLKNGKIVFGTSMNDYVNRVGDLVLQFFPGIKDEIRFYIVKSPTVNAFTNEQGIVFINIGLIAQLENEAQLAYIISHELIHYKYHHSFKSYTERIKANANWGDYRSMSENSKLGLLLQYSRSNEMMADSLGFLEAYSKTKYSYDEALNVFDVLLYSNLPFDEIEFDSTFFDDENYKVDSKYILSNVNLVSNPEDYDDSHMTHPNIKKRRSMMINQVTSLENPNTAKFLVSKEDFLKLQKEARFEMSNLYISNLQYGKAFYNSYLLLRKYPESKYLKKTIAYCLYSLAIHKKYGGTSDVLQSYKKMEGQSQRVNYFFKKANTKTLSSLSVKYLWKYHNEYPQDTYIERLLNAALELQTEVLAIRFDAIYPPAEIVVAVNDSDSTIEVVKDDFVVLSKEEYDELSKYDKIRYDKKYEKHFGNQASRSKRKTVKTKNYLKILSTESTNPKFKKLYQRIDDTEKEEAVVVNDVNHLVMVNPLFYQVKNEDLVVSGSEEKEMRFSNSLKEMAERRKVDMENIDILEISKSEVEKFNDLAMLNSWFREYESLSEIERMDIMIPWQTNYISGLREKYNMRYLATCGLLELESSKEGLVRVWTVIGSVIMWQISPVLLAKAFSNNHDLYHFFYCVDLETNEMIVNSNNVLAGKASRDFMNSLNYSVMYQLKEKK